MKLDEIHINSVTNTTINTRMEHVAFSYIHGDCLMGYPNCLLRYIGLVQCTNAIYAKTVQFLKHKIN